MNKFNVQVLYNIPTNKVQIWKTPVITVHANNRKDACLNAMASAVKVPEGSSIDNKDIKGVHKFWTFKHGSELMDPENGDILPGKL